MNPKNTLIICDIDGTLYEFENGFENSTVGESVKFNTENIALENNLSVAEMWNCDIGPTLFLANKIGKTRAEILQRVWENVEIPENGLPGFGAGFIQKAIKMGFKLQFLTAAGHPWGTKVLNYLDTPKFLVSELIAAHDFPRQRKDIAMTSILVKYNVAPENTWSIGDQKHTDIIPATKLGIKTFHITKENPLMNFFDKFK